MYCVALVQTKKYLLLIGKSKRQIMVEEKSICSGLSTSSMDQCQVSSLKKVRYDANIVKCEHAQAKNSKELKIGI